MDLSTSLNSYLLPKLEKKKTLTCDVSNMMYLKGSVKEWWEFCEDDN